MCDRIEDIHRAGAELIVVGNGSPEQARWFAEEKSVPVPVFTDPDREVYRALEARARPVAAAWLRTPLAALRAWREGFRQRGVKGAPVQLGAVAIIRPDGRIASLFRSRWAGDHPDPDRVLTALRAASPA